MIRVVLDTNILISALLQPEGMPARTLLIALAGTTAQLCVSGDIYAEYDEVIRRPKFNRSEPVIEQTLRAIRQSGFWVKPSEKVRACSDPDDDIFSGMCPGGACPLRRDRQSETFSRAMG
jgi:putative PIN family toxin of toxin-antitoxin system